MRVLVDTSAWSHFLRRDGENEVRSLFRTLIVDGAQVFLTGLIYQELLTGFRSEPRRTELIRRLTAFEALVPTRSTHEKAARLADKCLRGGVTVGTVDVLIAQLAIERECALLTTDDDYRSIAKFCSLELLPEPS